jgi:hypothetical protein
MITRVELDKHGNKARVYHQTDGGREAWTHPYHERKGCEVCQEGRRKLGRKNS